MNRLRTILCWLITAISALGWQKAAADAGLKVRLGTLAPRGSSYFKHLQLMGQQWRENAGVSLTIYPDAAMGSELEMVRRMRIGQIQAAMLTTYGLSEIEPAASGMQNIPMAFRTLEEVDYVSERLNPMLEKRLEAKGFVVLFWADIGWVRFFSRNPVVRPDDLRKEKLFTLAGSADALDLYRRSGFHPVPMEANDMVLGLRTGLVTATCVPPFLALAGQMYDPAPHMLDLNWTPLVGATVITRKFWDQLPPAGQEALRKAATEAGPKMKMDSRRESVVSVEAMQKHGLTVHHVPPAAEAAWREAAEMVYAKIRGGLVPADIFDEVFRLLKEYREQHPVGKG